MYLGFAIADPAPPNGVTPAVTGCDSAVVTWGASISMFETVGNYSVRYHMRNGTSGSATVYTSSTSATLQGLAPNAEYNVSVAGINSCGGTSTFAMATFALQGNSLLMMSSVLLLCIVVLAPAPTSSCGTITPHF